jgi:hypothetical protein
MNHHLHHLHHIHLHHSTLNRHRKPLLVGWKQGVTSEDPATSNDKGDDTPTATTTE